MNKSLIAIVALAILALVGFVLFYMNHGRLAEKETLMQDQMVELQAEQKRLAEIESALSEARKTSERIAREAEEARRMAETQAAKERTEREKLVAELNQRLQREAEERREAEAAQAELAAKMAALQAAQAEAQAALAALDSARGTDTDADALRAKMEMQQQQLATLSRENTALRERQQLLESRQIATEEAIVSAGGRVELAFPEVRSPYMRRGDAVQFKNRIGGE